MTPPKDLTQICHKCKTIKECPYEVKFLTMKPERKPKEYPWPKVYICADCAFKK